MTLYVENHTVDIHVDNSIYRVRFEYDADGDIDNKGAIILEEKGAGATMSGYGQPMMTEEAWLLVRKAVDNMFSTHRHKQL
jgi:hypothetical protein